MAGHQRITLLVLVVAILYHTSPSASMEPRKVLNIPEKIIGGVIDIVQNHKNKPAAQSSFQQTVQTQQTFVAQAPPYPQQPWTGNQQNGFQAQGQIQGQIQGQAQYANNYGHYGTSASLAAGVSAGNYQGGNNYPANNGAAYPQPNLPPQGQYIPFPQNQQQFQNHNQHGSLDNQSQYQGQVQTGSYQPQGQYGNIQPGQFGPGGNYQNIPNGQYQGVNQNGQYNQNQGGQFSQTVGQNQQPNYQGGPIGSTSQHYQGTQNLGSSTQGHYQGSQGSSGNYQGSQTAASISGQGNNNYQSSQTSGSSSSGNYQGGQISTSSSGIYQGGQTSGITSSGQSSFQGNQSGSSSSGNYHGSQTSSSGSSAHYQSSGQAQGSQSGGHTSSQTGTTVPTCICQAWTKPPETLHDVPVPSKPENATDDKLSAMPVY